MSPQFSPTPNNTFFYTVVSSSTFQCPHHPSIWDPFSWNQWHRKSTWWPFRTSPVFIFPESMFEGWIFYKFSHINNFGVESVAVIILKIWHYLKKKFSIAWISATTYPPSLRQTGCWKYPFSVMDPFLGAACPGSIPLGLANLPHHLWIVTSWNKDSGPTSCPF